MIQEPVSRNRKGHEEDRRMNEENSNANIG